MSTLSPSPNFFGRVALAKPKVSVSKNPDALRIGILGAANIASNSLINPAKAMTTIVVASVAARDQTKAQEYATKLGIPKTHSSYDALIADPEIDCVYNPLPNGLHYPWTKKALEAGKHVLLEKPAASNAAQTKELVALAKSKNLILVEAFHYRYHPASIEFRRLLREHLAEGHALKEVKSIISIVDTLPKTDIRFNWSLAGGMLMDCGCYTINAIRYFTGLEVESVEAAKAKIVSENIDGRMDATLNLKGAPSAKAHLVASLTNPWLSLQSWKEIMPVFTAETESKVFTFGVFVMPGAYHYLAIKDKTTGQTTNLPKVYAEGYSSYRYQLEAFVKAVRHGSADESMIPGWVSGEDSVSNMEAIDAIYKSAGMKLRE